MANTVKMRKTMYYLFLLSIVYDVINPKLKQRFRLIVSGAAARKSRKSNYIKGIPENNEPRAHLLKIIEDQVVEEGEIIRLPLKDFIGG